jgi:ribosomal protein L24
MAKTFNAAGKKHTVKRNKKGDIVVDHAGKSQGKYDKINLTKKAGAKTIAQGVAATKRYHRKHGH